MADLGMKMVNFVVTKENNDLMVWLQDDTDNTFGSWEYFADNFIDKHWKLHEMLEVEITFISGFCCLSIYNYFLLQNMQIIFGFDYHLLSVVCRGRGRKT